MTSRAARIALLSVGLIACAANSAAAQNAFQGLWVGEVQIDAVSASNVPVEDVSFDLQLSTVERSIDASNQTIESSSIVLPARSSWCYWADGVEPPDVASLDWTQPGYTGVPADCQSTAPLSPASGWGRGSSEFGFGDGEDSTCVGGPTPGASCTEDVTCGAGGRCAPGTLLPIRTRLDGRAAPYYFRHEFVGPDPARLIDDLDLSLIADDGAIVYLNGTEVLRFNLPARKPSDPEDPESSLEPESAEGRRLFRPLRTIVGDKEALFTRYRLEPAEVGAEAGTPRVVDGFSVVTDSDSLSRSPATNVLAVQIFQRDQDPAETDIAEAVPVVPQDAGLSFRLLIHVDATGQARLLDEVILMQDRSTGAGDVQAPVLITNDELIPDYEGISLIDGRLVGARISTAAFDFDCQAGGPIEPAAYATDPDTGAVLCDGPTNAIDFLGTFGTPSVDGLVTHVQDPFNAPTNPFQHRFHPDHDNKNASFEPYTAEADEAFAVSRRIQLDFSNAELSLDRSDTDAAPHPDFGSERLNGEYTETLSGLHRNDIVVKGIFRLQRSSTIGELNPTPGGGS